MRGLDLQEKEAIDEKSCELENKVDRNLDEF